MNNTTDDDLAPRRDHESNAEFVRFIDEEGGVPARDLRTFAALDTAESLRSIAESLRVVAGWAVWQMNNR